MAIAATVSASHVQAQSNRWIEVERINGTVAVQTSQSRGARVGDRLTQAGHGITTQGRSSSNLKLDTNIGSIAVAQNTQISIERLEMLSNGARVTVLDVARGQARIQARPFTNPDTILELRTPSGIAAVRGTEFGITVAEDGKTSVATLEGRVAASAQSVTVNIDPGEASIIRPGEPPIAPVALDRELNLEWLTQERRGNTLFVRGRVNPANTVLFQDREIPVRQNGTFDQQIRSARRNQSITFTVQNPLGESRLHRIRPWQLPDLDRGSDRDR